MKINLQVKLIVAFAVVLFVTTGISAFGYITQTNRTETIGWIDHTNDVMMEADRRLNARSPT